MFYACSFRNTEDVATLHFGPSSLNPIMELSHINWAMIRLDHDSYYPRVRFTKEFIYRRDFLNLGPACTWRSKPQRGRKNVALLSSHNFESDGDTCGLKRKWSKFTSIRSFTRGGTTTGIAPGQTSLPANAISRQTAMRAALLSYAMLLYLHVVSTTINQRENIFKVFHLEIRSCSVNPAACSRDSKSSCFFGSALQHNSD